MKRIASIAIALILAVSFLLAGYSPAQAESGQANFNVTVLTGDATFTAKGASPSSLGAAVFQGENDKFLPVGFPKGEKAFSGNALILSDISYGSQKTCFSFPGYSYGWRGSIYAWGNNAWKALETSIAEGSDGSTSQACTTTYGNGTYALIVYFVKSEAAKPKETCAADLDYDSMELDGFSETFSGIFRFNGSEVPAPGTTFTWKITNLDPAGYFWPLSGSGVIDSFGFANISGVNFSLSSWYVPFSFDLKIFTPECHVYHVDSWW